MHEMRGPESALTSIMPTGETGGRPDDGGGQAGSAPVAGSPLLALCGRRTPLATPVSIGMLHPLLGGVIALIEVAVALTVIGTALFGSPALSERAFRLLRWIRNQPEPRSPASGSPR